MKTRLTLMTMALTGCALATIGVAQAQGPQDGSGRRGGPGEGPPPRIDFRDIDGNADGGVTYEEFLAAHDRMLSRRAQRFEMLDADGNGSVTLEEFLADGTQRVADRYQRLDADGNGIISAEEWRNRPRPQWRGKRGGRGGRGGQGVARGLQAPGEGGPGVAE